MTIFEAESSDCAGRGTSHVKASDGDRAANRRAALDQGLVDAAKFLNNLIDPDAYVGEVYSLGYDGALVQIHDFHRRQVGGIPALSFLITTRVNPTKQIDVREEDSSVILLRVLDQADLPNAPER